MSLLEAQPAICPQFERVCRSGSADDSITWRITSIKKAVCLQVSSGRELVVAAKASQPISRDVRSRISRTDFFPWIGGEVMVVHGTNGEGECKERWMKSAV